MPKYLLALRTTSFFLKPHSSTMSLGSNRVCSRAKATWYPMPLLNPDWCVIHQGFTTKHRCWEPSLGPWGLNIYPFRTSARDLANFLLLCSLLSLLFASGTRFPSLHHVLTFLLFIPLRINLFGPRGQGWIGSRGRRLRRRRWKLGLSKLPRTLFSWLVLYQLHQAFLRSSLNAHLFW